MTDETNPKMKGGGRFAAMVAAGILASRVFGLIRERVFAHYFGSDDAADAFKAAFRIPNFLQNLFGEGVLSASFIPVYANLIARGKEEEANRVAGAIAALLALIMAVLVMAGIAASPLLVTAIVPGFGGEKRDVIITLVRILFPGAGLLVMSAWCLGILNSHRKFLLPYAAPVIWNAALIVTMLFFGGSPGGSLGGYPLAIVLAGGSVAGSALQLIIQLPSVFRLARGLRFSLDISLAGVRTIAVNFVPVFVSRGVVQISAFIDEILASLLHTTGALAALGYAQTLYLLPVSLFGMSVSAAELPVMSSAVGGADEVAAQLRTRLDSGLRRIAFFIVPSAAAFLAFGDVIAGAIYQTGKFGRADAVYVWGILAGAAVGLLASTQGRLYSSAFYALKDTRTPLYFAVARVLLTTILGYICSQHVPALLGFAPKWGVVGLTASAGVSAWIEFSLLRRGLKRRIGKTGLRPAYLFSLWGAAGAGIAAGWGVKIAIGNLHPVLTALVVLGVFGGVYLSCAVLMKIPEMRGVAARFRRLIKK